jgi:DNA repair exonuclease SbcCD ATPase subunit
MILFRIHILGFGKLKDTLFEFQPGFNLVYAANEGGKSTLQRFLVGMLYGQLRSDLKVQRRIDQWVEQYKPWHGREYGGIIWCRLSDGREMEVHRVFGKDELKMEIRASSGEDITRHYEQQRNGEVLFARTHFGLPKELFESVGIIRESRVAELNGSENIRDRIANLAQSGNEELSIRRSLDAVREKLEFIGSDRAPTKPYRQAMDLVQNLQNELKAFQDRRAQYQSWIEERNSASSEAVKLERELAKIRKALLSARRKEVAEKIRLLEELESNLDALRTTIEALGAREDFPSHHLEELNELMGARDTAGRHLSELRTEKAEALDRLSRAESQRKELASYAAFAAGNDAEKITEWFVNYLSISLQKDGHQKTLARLKNEISALENLLNELSPAFKNTQDDWQHLAREAAEEEQSASQHCASLAEQIADERIAFSDVMQTVSKRKMLGGVMLGLAVVLLIVKFLLGINLMPNYYDHTLGIVLTVISGIVFNAAGKSFKKSRNIKQRMDQLQADLDHVKEQGSRKRRDLTEAVNNSGFQKLDDFLAAAKQSEQDRHKLEDLKSRLIEVEQQSERLFTQSEEIYKNLKEGLAGAGLACSPGNLKFQIDVFRANLRRYRELDAHCNACVQKVDTLQAKESDLDNEYNLQCSRIQAVLDQAQVETPERFREECSKRQRLLTLLDKEASCHRELHRLSENMTLPQWKDRLKELLEQRIPEGEPENSREEMLNSEGSAPLLPYLPTIAEAEEQEKQTASKLSEAREEYARAVERVKQAFHHFRPSAEIEEDLAVAECTLAGLERNRQALETAFETIEKLSRQEQEVLAPQLNAAVEQRFLRLCSGRYEEVKIDPDFQVWVREVNSGELRLAEHLSQGTQDQLYFALRFGVLDLISNPDEPCPCLLDEPFAAYDQTRLLEAFGVLSEEAARRQLIVFTCREDLLDLALLHDANIIKL